MNNIIKGVLLRRRRSSVILIVVIFIGFNFNKVYALIYENSFLAPQSNLFVLSQNQDDREIEDWLFAAGLFTDFEVEELNKLRDVVNRHIADPNLWRGYPSFVHQERFIKAIKNNLSLYPYLEAIYLSYPYDDPFKAFLYEILMQVGTAIGVTDERNPRKLKYVQRMTEVERLIDTHELIVPYLPQHGTFYEMGASFGSDTLDLYKDMQSEASRRTRDVKYVLVDWNFVQYVFYDRKAQKKIFINSYGEPVYARDVSSYDDFFIDIEKMKRVSKPHKAKIAAMMEEIKKGNRRFIKDGDLVLERMAVVNPEIKKGQYPFALQQLDLTGDLPESMEPADVIRVMNVLQYYRTREQKAVFQNLLSILKPNGRIVFNIKNFTTGGTKSFDKQDCKFTFVLQKNADESFKLLISVRPKYRLFFIDMFLGLNPEIRATRKLLKSLSINWHEEIVINRYLWQDGIQMAA